MSNYIEAASPDTNAAVLASAGTGKTWLLVTRIVRLLLDNARPDGILAVTFTRKAAAEMLTRLNDHLRELASLPEKELIKRLEYIGAPTDTDTLIRSRELYEELLFNTHAVRATTFHAFCQELLRRFPLEAEIPPGFELIDSTGSVAQQAWDALFEEATREPDSKLAKNIEALFEHCGGLFNTRSSLLTFLNHRSDWWAFTENCKDPIEYAEDALTRLLKIDLTNNFQEEFLTKNTIKEISEFISLLDKHPIVKHTQRSALLTKALQTSLDSKQRFEIIVQAFFSKKEPYIYKETKAQKKSMGEEGEAQFLKLQKNIVKKILLSNELIARQETFLLSKAWYIAGSKLLEHFQRIKHEMRCLDFTDLEWSAYKLLRESDNAHWVQYKLDQRIDHFLIDEFQDTNPTQWRLLLTLLEELAAGEAERKRSVFLVGDAKQSIYRFRRANPFLLGHATDWIKNNISARQYQLDSSRRSSPAIIQCVNAVFSDNSVETQLPSYQQHKTFQNQLWGRVEVLPLCRYTPDVIVDDNNELRNPLQKPRVDKEDQRHYLEGKTITGHILSLINSQSVMDRDGCSRHIRYSDIFILLRKRTHSHAIERAMREAAIPYIGADRGTLLESIEIRDMEALLFTLLTPFNNLALAQILRSPLFDASNDDLIRLASGNNKTWYERLMAMQDDIDPNTPLGRAGSLIYKWHQLSGKLPVHDLLDKIYSEGDLFARYESAYPEALRPRVRSNLARFLELALEVDSGRYPSLANFLSRLQELREHPLDAPDEPPSGEGEDRVQIMTIHAAKGLEAPVVFLADTTSSHTRNKPYQALINWPGEAAKPEYFLLSGKQARQDSLLTEMFNRDSQADLQENANLLYVALTRAKQYLIITGSEPVKGKDLGWYGLISKRLDPVCDKVDDILMFATGSPAHVPEEAPKDTSPAIPVDPKLSLPVHIRPVRREIAPSYTATQHDTISSTNDDGKTRGIVIHRILELLTDKTPATAGSIISKVASETGISHQHPDIESWYKEAAGIIGHPEFDNYFNTMKFDEAYNEAPIQYKLMDQLVHGIIDRVVISNNEVYIIDYKTHREVTSGNLDELAEVYREQMRLYEEGIQRIWPDFTIHSYLLFTACQQLYEYK